MKVKQSNETSMELKIIWEIIQLETKERLNLVTNQKPNN